MADCSNQHGSQEEQGRGAGAHAAAGAGQGRQEAHAEYSSAFDPAAGKDVYEPEKIIGKRLAKGVTQYNVKWATRTTP